MSLCMPDRIEVNGFGLVVSAVDHGSYWQGVVHIFGPDSTHMRSIETSGYHPNMAEAETVASRLGTSFVQAMVYGPS